MAKLTFCYPLKPYTITQKFGECSGGTCATYHGMGLKGHNGIDSVAATGTIVRAAHDGVVTFAGEDGSGGYGIVLRTNTQFDYNTGQAYYKTIYWHLLPSGIKVHAGQQVKAGDIIALSDNTGISTGPHLHFGCKPVYPGESGEDWNNAEQENGFKGAIDPAPFFTGLFAEDQNNEIIADSVAVQAAQHQMKGNLKLADILYAIAQLIRAFGKKS